MAATIPELIELNRIRLEEDKGYGALAREIDQVLRASGSVGSPIAESSLYRLLAGTRTPTDRTLFKIRRYLDARKARHPKRRPRSGHGDREALA